MKKIKLLSVVLSMLLLVGMMSVVAFASDSLDIRYDVKKTDTQYIISCYADSNPGVEGGTLYFPYNSSAMTFLSYNIPDDSFMHGKMNAMTNAVDNCVYTNFESNNMTDITGTGLFSVITFDIIDASADPGFTTDWDEIAAVAKDGSGQPLTVNAIQTSCCNEDIETVFYTLSIEGDLPVETTAEETTAATSGETAAESGDANNGGNTTGADKSTPNTGDTSIVYIALGIAVISAGVIVIIKKRLSLDN